MTKGTTELKVAKSTAMCESPDSRVDWCGEGLPRPYIYIIQDAERKVKGLNVKRMSRALTGPRGSSGRIGGACVPSMGLAGSQRGLEGVP